MLDTSRVEKKYLVNVIDMASLKERLAVILKPDAHNGTRGDGYIVRSVYFDSATNMDYYAKLDGVDNRKKIRIRIYSPQDNKAKLELKEKLDGRQRKRSIIITKEQALMMLAGDYSFLYEMDDSLAKSLYLYMTKELYRPKCMIEYDRYAFIHQENETRVTFDQNLRSSLDTGKLFEDNIFWLPVAAKSQITMEVKYNNFLLSGVKNAISNRISIVISNSKYCLAREKMNL